jgi:uncharacterized membrane protein YeaQ/YmgE (transglycosylase-associated protein family)
MMVEATPPVRGSPSERSAKEKNMGIISWIVVGLIAGALAKLVLPGDDPGGIIVTTLIGMVGAIVGGFVFGIFGGTGATGFNVWSILVATVGAIVLLLIYRLIVGRRTT